MDSLEQEVQKIAYLSRTVGAMKIFKRKDHKTLAYRVLRRVCWRQGTTLTRQQIYHCDA